MDLLANISLDERLAAMADPSRLTILRLLMARPGRLVDLGEAMGKHRAWVRHHLMKLVDVGLVELIEVRKVVNVTEKWYRATAAAYAAHVLVVPDTGDARPVVILGSDDLALRALASEPKEAGLVPVSVGSLDGLVALRQGLADMAGCHLLDVDGTYNGPYVRHLFPDRSVVMITLAHREQGLVTASGNPLGLRGVEDLIRPGVRIVARNAGSGTRVWLDQRLRALGVDPEAVMSSATTTASTHAAAVEAIAAGRADAAIAIRAAAEQAGLEFTPLFHERYDLVVAADRLDDPGIARIAERLQERGFRRKVGALAGYDPTHTGDEERITA